MKLHDGEVDIAADRARRLLTDQIPHLADRAVIPVVSTGTVTFRPPRRQTADVGPNRLPPR
jgi:hypothetical protein